MASYDHNSFTSSSLKIELQIAGAKNIQAKHKGAFFSRCYISAGKSRRIQVNTKEIVSPKKNENIHWDDTFSLECNGTYDSINNLQEENIVFELRWRSTKTNILGKSCSSKLIARAQVPWKDVFEAPNMEVQRWVFLTSVDQLEECMKPPALQVVIKIEFQATSNAVSTEEMKTMSRRERMKRRDECGCHSNGGCYSCADNELLYVAAALDLF